ncbi:MAG: hypothetical protein IKF52_07090 [Clostridia bacterium]|nr:hypothetical protein [Clostridia bacterium]
MKIFREIVSMIAIAIVVVLILVLVFYDFLADGNEVPKKSNYIRSSSVKEVLADKEAFEKKLKEDEIGTLSKAAYDIDNNDINYFIDEGVLTQGKVNPFAEKSKEEESKNPSNPGNPSDPGNGGGGGFFDGGGKK